MIRAAALCLLVSPAAAQEACAPRDVIVQALGSQYSEMQVGAGLSGDFIIEVWVSENTGTWTILRTGSNGMSCVTAAGTDWQSVAAPPPGEPG